MSVYPFAIAAVLVGLAGAAQAETADRALASASADKAVFDLNAAVRSRYAEAMALKGSGLARTSVDHRFAGDSATGALGFLCGRPDSLDERASAGAYGSDPRGRFLGARLSFVFR